MRFGQALEILEAGGRAARSGWNGKGMWLEQQNPDEHSKMTLPYLYLNYPEGSAAYPAGARVPWLASQTDQLAGDWEAIVVGEAGYAEELVSSTAEKPPIGVMPRKVYDQKLRDARTRDLLDAMTRFSDAGRDIPIEWAEELNEITLESAVNPL